jgi:hypothetical protein
MSNFVQTPLFEQTEVMRERGEFLHWYGVAPTDPDAVRTYMSARTGPEACVKAERCFGKGWAASWEYLRPDPHRSPFFHHRVLLATSEVVGTVARTIPDAIAMIEEIWGPGVVLECHRLSRPTDGHLKSWSRNWREYLKSVRETLEQRHQRPEMMRSAEWSFLHASEITLFLLIIAKRNRREYQPLRDENMPVERRHRVTVPFNLPICQPSPILPGDFVVVLASASKYKSTFLRNTAAFAIAVNYPTSFVSCQHCAHEEERRIHAIAGSAGYATLKAGNTALRVLDPFRATSGTSFLKMFTVDALLSALGVDITQNGTKLILVDAPEMLFSRDPEQAEEEIRQMKLFCLAHSVSMIVTAQGSRRGYENALYEQRWDLEGFKCAGFAQLADVVIGLLTDTYEEPQQSIKLQWIKSYRACPADTFATFVPSTGELRALEQAAPRREMPEALSPLLSRRDVFPVSSPA